ncbi:hypothetical protein HAX54_018951 [Datura stramonium]|uniref:Ribosomal protein L10 n=1 Tax=Datura stramonium TaxID=4076 RepID=A0ABS8UPT3_DATST|nr:hypothetical protein [Datura stramonium]
MDPQRIVLDHVVSLKLPPSYLSKIENTRQERKTNYRTFEALLSKGGSVVGCFNPSSAQHRSSHTLPQAAEDSMPKQTSTESITMFWWNVLVHQILGEPLDSRQVITKRHQPRSSDPKGPNINHPLRKGIRLRSSLFYGRDLSIPGKRRSLLKKKILLRVSGEERSPEILISFHSSGSTSNQWRKLKNPWFPGRTLFRRSCFGIGKKKRFFAQLAHSVAHPLERIPFLLVRLSNFL